VFATNLLTIIVAPDNPLGITGVEDLANPDLNVVVCSPEVPCGNYADQIFTAAGVEVTPVSLEQNVRGVVTKVTAGEADAGIVYVTDVIAAGDEAAMVEIPEDINVIAEYPIADVAASESPDVGQAFIDFVLGDEGQAILAEYGFGPPEAATAPSTTEVTGSP
jgi:molybdate transport system substrate-binding protein